MSTDVALLLLAGFFFMLLCSLQRWLYVCLVSLVEVVWAIIICTYARLSLEFFDVALYFWAFGWLFVATVESIAGIFSFVVYSQLTGQIYT